MPVLLNLDEDVWISGMEFLPGDREVLHHVIAYLTSPADKTAKLVPLAQGRISQGLLLEDSLITLVKIAVG